MWLHNYYAIGGNIFLTALCAAIPMFFLFWALAIKRIKGHIALLSTLGLTMIVAILVFGMPVPTMFAAASFGAMNGVFPLCWLVFNAVLFYNLVNASGKFEIIKTSIATLSNDRRVQIILIGYCFSAFLEGTTAQGAPVAIAAAMLVGLGFPIIPAAVLCLVGNTVPVPFGPVGMPTITMANTAQVDVYAVTASVGGIMCLFALFIPAYLVIIMAGTKATKEVLPVCIVASVTYIIPNWYITQYMGPELPSLLSPLVSLAGVIILLKVWKPKTIWRFENDAAIVESDKDKYTAGQVAHAWMPFILVTGLMFIWSLQSFKTFAADLNIFIRIAPWPGMFETVARNVPVVAEPAAYNASYAFNMVSAVGTALLLSSIGTMIVFKMAPGLGAKVLASTAKQLRFALITLVCVISIAHLSNYSGISFTLGLAFAATGPLFLIFSPCIGFLGVFLTGSVTSSGALFGNLQKVTAISLGMNPLITISASMTGAVMGKLVSPQTMAIVAAACGIPGREGEILRGATKYAFITLGISIVVMLVLGYGFPSYFPMIDF